MITIQDAIDNNFNIIDTHETLSNAKNERIAQIKAILPNVINSDDQLDIKALNDLLGAINTTSNNQGYELTFAGKGLAWAKADTPTTKELKVELSQSKNFDSTDNVIIRGDNLDTLKILYKNYHNKIKMIYIDPPYNTKSENFVYNDNFKQSESELIDNFGLNDDTCNFLNNVYGTRSHSGWLSFIYPRLILAKELLTDDGVIFISIDDNEQANLKIICDEIFGEENFVGNNIWIKKNSPQNDAKTISPSHDYILSYAKNIINYNMKLLPRDENSLFKFKNPDNDSRGAWTAGDLTSKTKAAGHSYPIVSPSGKEFLPTSGRQWGAAFDTYQKWLSEGRIWFGVKGDSAPKKKQFLSEIQQGIVPMTLWKSEQAGDNTSASKVLKNLEIPFEAPKPIQLIKHAMKITINPNCLVPLSNEVGYGMKYPQEKSWKELWDKYYINVLRRRTEQELKYSNLKKVSQV